MVYNKYLITNINSSGQFFVWKSFIEHRFNLYFQWNVTYYWIYWEMDEFQFLTTYILSAIQCAPKIKFKMKNINNNAKNIFKFHNK